MANQQVPHLFKSESGEREERIQLKSMTSAKCEVEADCAYREDNCPWHGERRRCVAECIAPFSEPKSKEFCWQNCPKGFPHLTDGKRKCARSETAWDELNMDKLAKAAKAVIGVVNVIFAFVNGEQEKGIESMNSVFQSGVEFAQTFSFAECEMPHELYSIVC